MNHLRWPRFADRGWLNRCGWAWLAVLGTVLCPAPALAMESEGSVTQWSDWVRVLSMRDHNTRVVVIGTGLLGMAAGVVGSFALLRRRALMGDALSHATLPGIGIAFLIATALGGDGKSLPVLLLGATISGGLGILAIVWISRLPRLKEDAALGIVLSVFFGLGIAILVLVQQTSTGSAAGLESFIYGKTASMLARDSWQILIAGSGVTAIATVFFKELKLLCFDENFARSRGYSRFWLDLVLMSLIVIVTIIGLQAVGLILMIALLVIPPAAARFWTQRVEGMTWIAAMLGGVSAMLGSAISAVLPDLPSGATIVIICSVCFLISLLFGTSGGTVFRMINREALHRKMGQQHLLRAIFEQLEIQANESGKRSIDPNGSVELGRVLAMRSWDRTQLCREIARAVRRQELVWLPDDRLKLTPSGYLNASRLVHEHRLWEMYLITHAEIAPGKVDRDADMIEHVLSPTMIAELERLLIQQKGVAVVASPHPIDQAPHF